MEKVIIPNRGVVALDIIDSLKSLGLETILLHSPEDSFSLPVKLADKSYKFYSSRLEDSYMDLDSIIEKAVECKADYIHPGYGFLSEEPEFPRLCKKNKIKFIGPEAEVLEIIKDKIALRKMASGLGISILKHSNLIKSSMDFNTVVDTFKFPYIVKPLKGTGGKGIRIVENKKEAREQINEMLKRPENQEDGIFIEEFLPSGHHIEIPFFRDINNNILFLPEIESSIQRRFQKIFQESPSVNISEQIRVSLYEDSKKIIDNINYIGLGYVEFIIFKGKAYFSEINPSFQVNTLISEIHIISNFLKKQFAISRGELLHNVDGVTIIEPKYSILLVSLMAENPFNNFQPSSGIITEFFKYSTIRNIFKSSLYTGARISPLYDPYIGKIVTFSTKRKNSINDMKNFLDNIIIRGVSTNLYFLKCLLGNEDLARGDTIIDFLAQKWDFSRRKKSDEEFLIAAALLSTAFHIENRKNNYTAKLEKMKQPGFFKRLLRRF